MLYARFRFVDHNNFVSEWDFYENGRRKSTETFKYAAIAPLETDLQLRDYYLLPALRGHLLVELGRPDVNAMRVRNRLTSSFGAHAVGHSSIIGAIAHPRRGKDEVHGVAATDYPG